MEIGGINSGSTTTVPVPASGKTPIQLTWGDPDTTWDYSLAYNASLLLTGVTTNLVIDNVEAGDSGTIIVTQDETGARVMVLPAGSLISNGGTPLYSVTVNATDVLAFFFDGTNYFWTYAVNFSI